MTPTLVFFAEAHGEVPSFVQLQRRKGSFLGWGLDSEGRAWVLGTLDKYLHETTEPPRWHLVTSQRPIPPVGDAPRWEDET